MRVMMYQQTVLFKRQFAMCCTANETDRLDSDTNHTAVNVGVDSWEQKVGKSVELGEYLMWVRATCTAKQLQ